MEGTQRRPFVGSTMERVLEIGAVDEQASALLHTVEQTKSDLRHFREQRQHKTHLFTTAEHQLFDETDYYTQEAINKVAALVEGIRADAESGGKVRFRTRMVFAWKNSPKIQVALTQLGIAAQSLNRDLATIVNKNWVNPPKPVQPAIQVTEYYGPTPSSQPALVANGVQEFYNPHHEPRDIKPPPPAYEEALFLTEGRRRNQRRRESMQPGNATYASSEHSVSSLTHSPNISSQYRPSTEVVMELPSDEGFGPIFDRSPTPTSSIAPSDELFFEQNSEASPFRTFTHMDRHTRQYRAISSSSRPAHDGQILYQPSQPTVSGRQRSMRWLEARSGDSTFG